MDARLTRALERWNSVPVGPLFPEASVPNTIQANLPADYLAIVAAHGGREGCFGEDYLRLYRLSEIATFNLAYKSEELEPMILLFGSNGGGGAFGFRWDQRKASIVSIPFIPLLSEFAEPVAPDFTAFLEGMADTGLPADVRPEMLGMEIHEITPVAFGGDPTDPKNKVLVPAAKHPELSQFWTKMYVRLRNEQRGT